MPPIWLLTIILRTGIPSRFAKLAAYTFAVLVAAGLVWAAIAGFHAWLASERVEAVALDRADISAEVANRIIAADRSANANAAMAEQVADDNEKELDDAIAEPNANSTRVVSVLERMREQQKAGRR